MKKLLTLLICVISLFSLTACDGVLGGILGGNSNGSGDKIEGKFTFVAPDGAPALAIAKFINDGENFGTDAEFEYKVVSSTAINGAILSNADDFVIMPVNAATKLYKDNGKEDYVMTAVLTHGNFYVMSKSEDIVGVQDLIGRVVFVPNPGKVPDWTFKASLVNNGIEYVESDVAVEGKVAIKYYNTPQEFNPILIQNSNAVGLVPEPAVSVLKGKGVKAVLDLQETYDAINKSYPQAVMMVKKSVVNAHPTLIEKIEEAFSVNVDWVKQNPSDAVNAVKGKFDATTLNPQTISSATIDGCKIYWQSASDAKLEVNAYIQRITEINPSSANVVDENFYYAG